MQGALASSRSWTESLSPPLRRYMRKIAIVSDIHGNIAALERVVEDIQTRHVECVFNLGDHISGPLYPRETLEFLIKQDWVHVLGDHDRRLIKQDPKQHGPSDRYAFSLLNDSDLEWFRALPASAIIGNQFLAFHGTPASDTTYLLETIERGRARLAMHTEIAQRLDGASSQIMLCGHTHVPRVVEMPQNKLIINPGSVGLPAYDDQDPEYHVIETGSPHARYAVLEYKNGSWQAQTIAVAYDHRQAAEQARKNGRFDWEYALQTGFMTHTKAG
jgi:putative phosphoesterase